MPRDFLMQMRAAADITAIVGERVSLKKRGGNLFGLCPFHAEKTPSFAVSPARGSYHCFGCGVYGDALKFVIETECGGDFMAGVEALAARLGMKVPRGGDPAANALSDSLVQVLQEANAYFRRKLSDSKTAREYLRGRGLDDETVARFGIGFAPPGWDGLKKDLQGRDEALLIRAGLLRQRETGGVYDYFRGRLMFPILTGAKRVVGFGGRALDDDPAKYLNSPDSPVFSKKNMVFGEPQARAAAREKNRVIVVEGYMDVVMLSRHGFAETVAAMGTALTAPQIKIIARMADNVVFAFDGDAAGRAAAWRGVENMLPVLKDGTNASFLFFAEDEDPDSFVRARGADAFERALRSDAVRLSDYIETKLRQNAAAQTPGSERGRIFAEGEKLLRLVNAPFLRDELQGKLSRAARVKSAWREQNNAGAARYKMPETGLLFNLLCCLAARPQLLAGFPENPPLSGNARDCAVVKAVMRYVRQKIDKDEEPNIVAKLTEEGYAALAWQVRETMRQRYAVAAADPEADFRHFVGKMELQQKNDEQRRRILSAARNVA